jgi:hypothetical protein
MLFDNNGHLTPYTVIPTTLDDFKTHFVFNEHRERIFQRYLELLNILQNAPCGHFYQLLDGSFTTKKPFPNDLDLVNFVDWQFYRKFESRIRAWEQEFRWKYIDSYTNPVYPETDFKQYITIYGKNEKLELYGSDRLGKPKGIIQLNF